MSVISTGGPMKLLLYGVATVPDNFLIDGQGKVTGRDLLPKQLEKSWEALKN